MDRYKDTTTEKSGHVSHFSIVEWQIFNNCIKIKFYYYSYNPVLSSGELVWVFVPPSSNSFQFHIKQDKQNSLKQKQQILIVTI